MSEIDHIFGEELDWFDDFPDEDPFLVKPVCPNCDGLGVRRVDEIDYTCTWCGGIGTSK